MTEVLGQDTSAYALESYVGAQGDEFTGHVWRDTGVMLQKYLEGFGLVMVTQNGHWEQRPDLTTPIKGDFVHKDAPSKIVIPYQAIRRAYVEVAAGIYHRKNTKNGVAQFATAESVAPVRIAGDPLAVARAMLGPYLTTGGFA